MQAHVAFESLPPNEDKSIAGLNIFIYDHEQYILFIVLTMTEVAECARLNPTQWKKLSPDRKQYFKGLLMRPLPPAKRHSQLRKLVSKIRLFMTRCPGNIAKVTEML